MRNWKEIVDAVRSKKSPELYPAQKQFVDCKAIGKAFCGGFASGKTFVGAWDMLCHAEPNKVYLAAAPTYSMLEHVVYKTLRTLAVQFGMADKSFGASHVMPPYMELKNGARIILRSANDTQRGVAVSGAWLDESGYYDHNTARAFFDQYTSYYVDWVNYTLTPSEDANHWATLIIKQYLQVFTANTFDNLFVPLEHKKVIASQYGNNSVYVTGRLLNG